MSQARSLVGPGFASFAGRPIAVPAASGYVGIQEISSHLNISHALGTQLALSEWCARLIDGGSERRWCYRVGERLVVPTEGLEALAAVPASNMSGIDFINMRVGPGTLAGAEESDIPGESREFVGVHSSFNTTQLTDAVTRWWQVTRPEEWEGKAFVASLAGYVVLCGRITSWSMHTLDSRDGSGPRRLTRFEVDVDDSDILERFEGRRIPVFRGGSVLMKRA